MTNTTDTKTETPSTSRMRELAIRYAQVAIDVRHPAPHWDMDRELRILSSNRTQLAGAASVWRLEQGIADGQIRSEAATDALCDAACAYHAARAAYLAAPGRPDHTPCDQAWQAVEAAARA
jgi:hypothetical protein